MAAGRQQSAGNSGSQERVSQAPSEPLVGVALKIEWREHRVENDMFFLNFIHSNTRNPGKKIKEKKNKRKKREKNNAPVLLHFY